jgi:hypothetical protein
MFASEPETYRLPVTTVACNCAILLYYLFSNCSMRDFRSCINMSWEWIR